MSGPFLADMVAKVEAESRSPGYDQGVPARRGRSPSGFRRAIEHDRERGALVVEYKRSSPASSTPLPEPRTVEEFVASTRVDGVAAYSCLATRPGFDGTPARVAELVGRTDRPVLFKEFVVNERQLEVAARTGAAAVLLIARLQTDGLLRTPLAELARAARRQGLEVLLELHDSAELSRVDGVEADVYGVNTRDLSTLAIERARAYATIDRVVAAGLRPLLGLSGVDGPREAVEFWSRGCDGLLVGTAVARARDPSRFLASLRKPAREAP